VFAIISSNVSNDMGPDPEAGKGPKMNPQKREKKRKFMFGTVTILCLECWWMFLHFKDLYAQSTYIYIYVEYRAVSAWRLPNY
jgi:hypothetical protein